MATLGGPQIRSCRAHQKLDLFAYLEEVFRSDESVCIGALLHRPCARRGRGARGFVRSGATKTCTHTHTHTHTHIHTHTHTHTHTHIHSCTLV